MRKGRSGPNSIRTHALWTRCGPERELKRDTLALCVAAGDPRTPWLARVWLLAVAAYALSPIYLIPDVVPVLGYLDDLLLVPLGIWLGLRMIPDDVLDDARTRAAEQLAESGALRRWGIVIVAIAWLMAVIAVAWPLHSALRGR